MFLNQYKSIKIRLLNWSELAVILDFVIYIILFDWKPVALSDNPPLKPHERLKMNHISA